jgi:TldD protein
MKFFKICCTTAIVWSLCSTVYCQDNDVLLKTLRLELSREMEALKKAQYPPYYMDYRLNDIDYAHITSSFGSLIRSRRDRSRIVRAGVRIGDYQFDNTHQTEFGDHGRFDDDYGDRSGTSILPLEDKTEPLQYFLWMATQNAYRSAMEEYKFIKSPTTKPKVTTTPDFSKETAVKYYQEPPMDLSHYINVKSWEDKTRKFSSAFLQHKEILSGDITLHVNLNREYFVSTEGTEVVQDQLHFYLYINASVRAEDGDVLPLHKTYFAFTADQLPADEVVEKDVREMIEKLMKLRVAPVAEPYSGPAILHAQTAGVFFHEIFGHRIEGHRMKDENDGQTFKAKVKEQVLPSYISVRFDPTAKQIESKLLNGYFEYDDEGVKSRPVLAVEKGILKEFLMSRTPLDNAVKSNGHGRATAGVGTVSRQSNLIVETTKSFSMEDLRKMLIKECKRQGKPYGYFFKDVVGGFTNTERYTPNAFNIFPTEVYRIYTDGRADELVRGVDLIGTPLAMFAEITATGNDKDVFNGFCGAESGDVPVSAVAPSLYVKRIETQKKPKSQQDTTLLSRPAEQ